MLFPPHYHARMATWLIKSEPDVYSYDDLARDKKTDWSGVTNPAAQKHMRSIAKGDEVLFYHTGKEKRIAGLGKVVKAAYPDPKKPGTLASGEPKFVLFDVAPAKKSTKDCTLADIAGWASVGRFDIVTAIPTVIRGRQIISGYVVVSVTDIMQMFRRCGTGPRSARATWSPRSSRPAASRCSCTRTRRAPRCPTTRSRRG